MADAVQEVLDNPVALRSVHHLRVKLDAKYAFVVSHDGNGRVVSVCKRPESRRQLQHLVSVAHPDGCRGGEIGKDWIIDCVLAEDCVAVLPHCSWDHPAAKLVGQNLKPIAYPQDGKAAYRRPTMEP